MRNFYKPFIALERIDIAWLALFFIAIGIYVYGLGSPYAPTNGDEMVYIHIARMTSESGHWLPLQSELLGTRNTKPPLLIWQAMVAGGWGTHWSMELLRLPSVLYTFATAALVAFFTWHLAPTLPTGCGSLPPAGASNSPWDGPAASCITGKLRNACLAVVLYLLFFSTFRYGRAYLTSAPETFWLALPMWWVLWLRVRTSGAPVNTAPQPPATLGALAYTLFGVAMGLGCAYKSFALVAPTAAAVWCAVLLSEPKLTWRTTLRTTVGLGWSAALALGIFALWFVLDSNPAAVWQEFVVAENAGKMSGGQGYWHAALFGAYPMWTQLLAYPANAGLLFFAVLAWGLALLPRAVQRASYRALTPAQWTLLVWLAVWLVVFTIPSQRSERYVIPAMPALAIAMALAWEKLPRMGFLVTLALLAPALVLLARVAWVMGELQIASGAQLAMTLIASCAGLACVTAGFVIKKWARAATLAAVLAVYATFGLMVAPLSGANTGYPPDVQAALARKRIAVPNGFTGQYERFHFVLPGKTLIPYDAEGRNTGAYQPEMAPLERLPYLLGQFDAVVWLQDNLDQPQPSCLPQCRWLGTRWHVKSRHKAGEVTLTNLWYPQEWLFRREWLVAKVAN
jgi:4-amino-4-deoxy-L-arabinose transferase-like glycosyltransferase